MPVDSNRYQIFYCPPVVLPPQVQRPVPRQQSYNQELQSAVCSSSHRPQPHPPTQQSSSLLPIKLSTTTTPIEAKVTSSSSSSSGSFKGSDKTIKISITRKKLKVTRGNGGGGGEVDLVTSMLKPGREINGTGKLKRVRIRTQVQPITSIFKVKSPLTLQPNLKKSISSTTEAHVEPKTTISPSTLTSAQPVDQKKLASCSYCENYFNNYETLNDHMVASHYGTKMNGIFTCSLCETAHCDYEDYVNHCSNNHSIYPDAIAPEDQFVMVTPVTKLPRQCNICNINLNSTKEMKDHLTIHQGSSTAYQCRLCRQLISTLTLLKKHLESNHFVKFKCPPPSTLQQPLQLLSSTSSTSSTLNNGSQCSTFTAH